MQNMIIGGIMAVLVAGAIQLVQSAGQSIQQWLSSPAGQSFIQRCIQIVGQEGLQRILKKLGD